MIGVTLPIVIEYGAKGGRISEGIPLKWSGVVGSVFGGIELTAALAGNAGKISWPSTDEDVAMIGAMGGAKLATGVSILILDELRKRALYAFKKRGTKLPIGEPGTEGLERIEYPVTDLVEEI